MVSYQRLCEMVSHRLHQAYVPKTWSSYKSMFMVYMMFCEFMHLDSVSPSLVTILTFIKFLAYNGLKHSSILNYVSALKAQFNWFELPAHVFDHPKVKLMLKALERSIPASPKFKGLFDIQDLQNIVEATSRFEHPLLYKALYLLAFFGFFRISNLVPESKNNFNVMKQLCRGDIIYDGGRAIVVVKWSKTIQSSAKGTFIVIPCLHPHPLCPVTALQQFTNLIYWPKNFPLFMTMHGPITQSQTRTHLNKVLKFLHMDASLFCFHTFRRSGATLAFNSHVQVDHIKRHGTWSSEAVYAYILDDTTNATQVADAFLRLFTTPTMTT